MKRETSLKDNLYTEILGSILRGEYRPNQIINERELTERYGCSKSPVREALIALCNDYVLRSIPRYGYEVIPLSRQDVDDMLRTRYMLEGSILKLTYDQFTPGQLKKLAQLDEACTTNESCVWRHWESNTMFHNYLISVGQNNYAQSILAQTMRRLKRAYSQFFIDQLDEMLALSYDTERHQQIIDALARKDCDAALLALKEDLQCFGNICCNIPDLFN